jgi:hypothetical protein
MTKSIKIYVNVNLHLKSVIGENAGNSNNGSVYLGSLVNATTNRIIYIFAASLN